MKLKDKKGLAKKKEFGDDEYGSEEGKRTAVNRHFQHLNATDGGISAFRSSKSNAKGASITASSQWNKQSLMAAEAGQTANKISIKNY